LKKLSLIAGGVASLLLGTFLATRSSEAADHLDSASLATNPMADINDVYTWMTSDMSKLNLVMTVSPGDPGTRAFSDAVQYVFHVWSRAGATPDLVVVRPGMGTETNVVCTFTSDTAIQCWVVSGTTVKDYVKGDPTAAAGITSASGKLKVHAGRHSDPFFFNLQGFRNAISAVKGVLAGGTTTFNGAGCPDNLNDTTTGTLRTVLSTQQTGTEMPMCSTTNIDCFAAFNVKAIVVQVDKTLVNEGSNHLLAVYGSTHAKP
jgi:hypothetical protein